MLLRFVFVFFFFLVLLFTAADKSYGLIQKAIDQKQMFTNILMTMHGQSNDNAMLCDLLPLLIL